MSVYGTVISQLPSELFSPVDSTALAGSEEPARHQVSACAYAVKRSIHKTAAASFRCPSELQRYETGRECSPVCHRLRLWGLALGAASPSADCHGAGTLGLTVCRVLTCICAYSVRHPHFRPLHRKVSTAASLLPERSPTPDASASRPSFGGPLNPDHSRRVHAGPVSYYALFKGMAASKPTSRLSR